MALRCSLYTGWRVTMRAMPDTSASGRLGEMMDQRASELRRQWVEVAKRGKVSTESVLQARKGKRLRGITEAGIEEGLSWQRGSMQAIRDGGQPTPLPDSGPPPAVDRPVHAGAESAVTVLEAIENDPNLLPEAKEHLLNQYRLLLRIDAAKSAASAVAAVDEELERRIVAKANRISADPSLTNRQKARLVDIMESEERSRVPAFDGRRNPHLDVRFEESDGDLSEDEAAAALAEESQARERQPNGC